MISITQIDQCSLKCLATLIGIEVEDAVKNDPDFMARFEAWKEKRDKEGKNVPKEPERVESNASVCG
jgi:predicted RecB family nuclease